MKSNVINILNMDEGHDKAIREVKKVADYEGLEHKESMQLQLLAEEMLGLLKSVAGDVKASFWIEAGQGSFCLYLSTKTEMDMEKREQFLREESELAFLSRHSGMESLVRLLKGGLPVGHRIQRVVRNPRPAAYDAWRRYAGTHERHDALAPRRCQPIGKQ